MISFSLTNESQLPKTRMNEPFPVAENVNNVVVSECVFTTKNGWNAVDVTYERDGTKISDRMFLPTKKSLPFKTQLSEEEYYAQMVKGFQGELSHIAICSGVSLEGGEHFNTLEDLSKFFCKAMNSQPVKNKMYLKTTRNKEGYVAVARNPAGDYMVPFCQTMVEGEECMLKYTKRDKRFLKSGKLDNGVDKSLVLEKEPIMEDLSDDDNDWLDKV